MKNSAQTRRDDSSRRVFSFPGKVALDRPRRCLGWLAHLRCMSDSIHPVTGLEPVLTTSELAAHLGVPVQTIHDLRHSGRGPRGFRVGRELRYRLSAVQAWLAELEDADQPDRGGPTTSPVQIVGRGA
jgi:excisionase family DNA binding protein